MDKENEIMDSMCVDLEVNKKDERVYIWFVAIAGGHGPRFDMPVSLALSLRDKLNAVLR